MVHKAIHSGVKALKAVAMDAISFPRGEKLKDVIAEFEDLSGPPFCAGAIEGTFMKMRKPSDWGDSYWCYKNCAANIIMAVVDCQDLPRLRD